MPITSVLSALFFSLFDRLIKIDLIRCCVLQVGVYIIRKILFAIIKTDNIIKRQFFTNSVLSIFEKEDEIKMTRQEFTKFIKGLKKEELVKIILNLTSRKKDLQENGTFAYTVPILNFFSKKFFTKI